MTKRQAILSAVVAASAMTALARVAHADSVMAWDANDAGQLGNGTVTSSNSPVAVQGMSSGVTAVAAGGGHSLAIQSGTLYAWGSNNDGQRGDGTAYYNNSSTPQPVVGMTNGVTTVAGGGWHSLAIQNGTLFAWGLNDGGELGIGIISNSSVSTPTAVVGMSSGVTAVAGGSYHSLAIQNGALYSWGRNDYGQLGTVGADNRIPTAVSGMSSGVTAVAAGVYHSLAIQNGALYAWGYNYDGELGNGTTTGYPLYGIGIPVAVTGMSSGVTAVAAGNVHSIAVKNGMVYAWGRNLEGELGDGTTTNRLTPVLVDPTDLTNITAVAAGHGCSYALSADGSLWVWGDNTYGQLGLGNTLSYLTPQHLFPPSGLVFTSIDADADGGYGYGYHAIVSLAPAPEPASVAVLALGAVALIARRRRRS